MIELLYGFYKKSASMSPRDLEDADAAKELRRRKLAVFLSITFGYGFYYICRLSFSVAKKPMMDEGIFTATEMGFIGSSLFFAYAIGKFCNGFIADRVNIRRFMFTGLLISALINLLLGFTAGFWFFVILWGLNGWFQSFGAPASVVAISHWFGGKERGTYYGMWATSHNIGEAITFIAIATVITTWGWQAGFHAAGILCLGMALVILKFLYEKPAVFGLQGQATEEDKTDDQREGKLTSQHQAEPQAPTSSPETEKSLNVQQFTLLKNPVLWILALASAMFYVTRYAINSWGIFFLEVEKGYSTIEASTIIASGAIAGIIGTFASGWISEKIFNGRHNMPALIFGVFHTIAMCWFLLGPADMLMDTLSMMLFGLTLGALLVYLGGLMAIDICAKATSGAAMGIIGIASYIGAAIQDILSGYLIESSKVMVDGVAVYNFEQIYIFWIGASVVSLLLAALVWNAKSPDAAMR
ncbi:MAG: MFS transporter [Shewanella sp.]|nr:MFS transporter [Shewanella sp.]